VEAAVSKQDQDQTFVLTIKTVDGEGREFRGVAEPLVEEATAKCAMGLGFRFENNVTGDMHSYAPGSILTVTAMIEDE
jgi:hypothetical protein